MSVIEADWLQTAYASSRRPRVATRLAPTVRAPEMRLRSESLTGPRGAATGRRDPVASSARHDLCGCSQAYHRRPFAPHDQLIQPPALLSLGRCSRSGVPDHVGRPGIVVQTPQLERGSGIFLVVIAAFVVVGIHLPGLADALRDHPSGAAYLEMPMTFWVVKFYDLGIVVPAAMTVGVGLLRRRLWARKPAYAILGGYV